MKRPTAHDTGHMASLCSAGIAKATSYVRKPLGVIEQCGLKLKKRKLFV